MSPPEVSSVRPSPGNRDAPRRPLRDALTRALADRWFRWGLPALLGLVGLALIQVVGGSENDAAAEASATPPDDPLALLRGDTPLTAWSDPSTLEGRSVLVVGDSLLKAAAPHLRVNLFIAGAEQVTIVAMNGSTIGWAANQIVHNSGHDVVVIAAGTNNVVDGWNDDDIDHTERALRMVSTARCQIWVGPTAWRHPLEDGVRRTRVDPTSLVALLELYDQLEQARINVADWDVLAPALGELHEPDGIHHAGQGSAAYARFITATVVQHCTDAWTTELIPTRS